MRASFPVFTSMALAAVTAAGSFACAGTSSSPGAASSDVDAGDASDAAHTMTAVCDYGNPFSGDKECKAYTGTGWTEASASADCAKGTYGQPGVFVARGRCDVGPTLGACLVAGDAGLSFELALGGSNKDLCSTTGRACIQFLKGAFVASATCAGVDIPSDEATSTVFVWPTQSCVDAKPGEAPGASASNKVCTWNLISGCTEPGRKYLDYGSCADVYTNRPYYPVGGEPVATSSDARMQDTHYVSEAAWIKGEVEACACVCCHTDAAPRGASKWSIDKGPLWIDTMSNTAIAMFAGYVDSSALGAYNSADNNGFDRLRSAMPTTDPDRMVNFFKAEFDRRGVSRSWADAQRAIGGPLVEQQGYQPVACSSAEGVDSAGKVTWAGGGARYVYVLDAGSKNPGIPPNADMPSGVRWRLDVPATGAPLSTGIRFGETPANVLQRYPSSGAPAPLVSGTSYYLYVLQDVAIPLARCTFTAP